MNRFSALHVEDSRLDDDREDGDSVDVDCVRQSNRQYTVDMIRR